MVCVAGSWLRTQKANLTRTLTRTYTQGTDYTIAKGYKDAKREQILMTADCFKALCMLSPRPCYPHALVIPMPLIPMPLLSPCLCYAYSLGPIPSVLFPRSYSLGPIPSVLFPRCVRLHGWLRRCMARDVRIGNTYIDLTTPTHYCASLGFLF
jgi:hypothetical protein